MQEWMLFGWEMPWNYPHFYPPCVFCWNSWTQSFHNCKSPTHEISGLQGTYMIPECDPAWLRDLLASPPRAASRGSALTGGAPSVGTAGSAGWCRPPFPVTLAAFCPKMAPRPCLFVVFSKSFIFPWRTYFLQRNMYCHPWQRYIFITKLCW